MNWHDYFTYEEASGNLIWKPRSGASKGDKTFNTKYAGAVAGSMGYTDTGIARGICVTVRSNGIKIQEYAHRIISEMFDGPIPEGIQIDHKDGNAFNNRRSNHRRATVTQNRHNMRITFRNNSGLKGVAFDKARGLWSAEIRANGVRRHLGRFQTKGLAAVARAKAAIRYHGDFARFA
jgi:hypothetical protein